MRLFSRKTGSGPPLVVLHGLFGLSDNWNALARRWAESFTVYTVDLRNHGQSPHGEEWNYSVMSDDVVELFGTEKLHDITLLGHSMGGKTAMRLALNYPMAIQKLIVADIAPRRYPLQQEDVIAALLTVQPEKLTSRKEAELILSKSLRDEGTIQFLLKNLYWKQKDDGVKVLDWRFNLPVISRNMETIAEPTETPSPSLVDSLFIRGGRSKYITDNDLKMIPTVFPNSRFLTIPDAGHWVHADQPNAFYDAVVNFVNA